MAKWLPESQRVAARCNELSEIASVPEEEAWQYIAELRDSLNDKSEEVRCVALDTIGQLGSVAADLVPEVRSFLKHPKREIRRSALDALGLLMQGDPFAADCAADVACSLRDEKIGFVRASAALALGRLRAPGFAAGLRTGLQDADANVVASALAAAGLVGSDAQELVPDIARCLSHPARGVRAVAVGTLLKVGGEGEEQAGRVAALLADEDGTAREAAVTYFEFIGDRAASESGRIAEVLKRDDGRFQAAAMLALGFAKAGKFAPEVAKRLNSKVEDSASEAQSAVGADKQLPATMRRPACAAAMALALMGEEGWTHVDKVVDIIEDEKQPDEVRASCLHSLGLMGSEGVGYDSVVIKLLRHAAPAIRASGCFALGEFALLDEDYDRADAVAECLNDPVAAVREAAADALGKMPEEGPRRAEAVFNLLTDRVANVQVAAIRAMSAFGETGQMFATEVCRLVDCDDIDVRLKAIEVVGDMGDRGAALAEELAPFLTDPSPFIREEVLKALSKMGEEAAPFLSDVTLLMEDPVDAVREAAVQCHDALA